MKISFQMKIQNPGPSGYTPLYLACQQGHMYEMFDILKFDFDTGLWPRVGGSELSCTSNQLQLLKFMWHQFLRNSHFTSLAKGAMIQAKKLFELHPFFLIFCP